jgi:4-amino-4-deoxy-L-arabinose transferase-like glycosyltransferase
MQAQECQNRPQTRYIPNVRDLVRKNLRFFLLAAIAGLLLRALFIIRFPGVVNDSFVYGDIAKNWLLQGIYGLSGTDEVSATYIRLPGYPAFLAFIFSIFGMEHYRTVLVVQMFVDLWTCLVCADLARRFFGERQAKAAFLLAALCPFLANYSAAALTETLEIFFTALALDFALVGLQEKRLPAWAGCGICCGGAILLRPDGAMLPFCIVAYVAWKALRKIEPDNRPYGRAYMIKATAILVLLATAPLIPWTLRNWTVFDRFQPLAPRYANEEDEFVPMGFNQWTKTWMADYVSVEEVYWAVPGSPIDGKNLPNRAFDNAQQRAETESVIADYNSLLHVSPEIDRRFAALASERIRTHPVRYYVDLPVMRIADMWLRPRTEMLPCDSRWWEFNDELKWSALAVSLGVVGLFYVFCALVGWLQVRQTSLLGLMVLFVLARSLFLGTLENPEPRYTLEMYPVVIPFAAVALTGLRGRKHTQNERLAQG